MATHCESDSGPADKSRQMDLRWGRMWRGLAPSVVTWAEQIKAGTPQNAMYGFAIFYALCLVLNWWFYLRKNAYIKNP